MKQRDNTRALVALKRKFIKKSRSEYAKKKDLSSEFVISLTALKRVAVRLEEQMNFYDRTDDYCCSRLDLYLSAFEKCHVDSEAFQRGYDSYVKKQTQIFIFRDTARIYKELLESLEGKINYFANELKTSPDIDYSLEMTVLEEEKNPEGFFKPKLFADEEEEEIELKFEREKLVEKQFKKEIERERENHFEKLIEKLKEFKPKN